MFIIAPMRCSALDVEPECGLDAVVAQDLGDVGQLARVGVECFAGELVPQAVGVHVADAQVIQDGAQPAAGGAVGQVGGAVRTGARAVTLLKIVAWTSVLCARPVRVLCGMFRLSGFLA